MANKEKIYLINTFLTSGLVGYFTLLFIIGLLKTFAEIEALREDTLKNLFYVLVIYLACLWVYFSFLTLKERDLSFFQKTGIIAFILITNVIGIAFFSKYYKKGLHCLFNKK